jgi:hypothetical protein
MAKTKPESENPKKDNVTVLVTSDLRKRIEAVRKSRYSFMLQNQFLAHLVELGLYEEDIRHKKLEIETTARLRAAAELDYSEAVRKGETGGQNPRATEDENVVNG